MGVAAKRSVQVPSEGPEHVLESAATVPSEGPEHALESGATVHDLETTLSSAESYSSIRSLLGSTDSIPTLKRKPKPSTRRKYRQATRSRPLTSAAMSCLGPLTSTWFSILTVRCCE